MVACSSSNLKTRTASRATDYVRSIHPNEGPPGTRQRSKRLACYIPFEEEPFEAEEGEAEEVEDEF